MRALRSPARRAGERTGLREMRTRRLDLKNNQTKPQHHMNRLLKLSWCAAVSAMLTVGAATAQESAPAAAPEAPKTEATAATATLEQRVASMEAYFANTDPSAPLKDEKGNIPAGLTTVAASNPGPGHNGWMMTCAALVL